MVYMKNIRTYLNIFLCALLAMLGVGCHTHKKAVAPTPVIEPEQPEQQIRVKYGVPRPIVVQPQQDSINANDALPSDSVWHQAYPVMCLYGVPFPNEVR